MGAIVDAACPCGFSAGGLMGGGFLNFQTYCGAPALCESCGAFCVVNYLADDPRCPQCGETVRFYSDPELQKQARSWDRPVFEWNVGSKRGPLVLHDVAYLCPQCRQKTLRFKMAGNWD